MTAQHAGPIGEPTWWAKATAWAGRYRKGLAAVWGTLTVPAVVGVLALVGVHLDGGTAALIITVGSVVLGAGAVVGVKPNDPAPPPAAIDPLYAEDVPRTPIPFPTKE